MQDRLFDGLLRIQGWSSQYSEGVWSAAYTDPGSGAVLEIAIAGDGPRFIRTDAVGVATWPDFWAGIDLIREVMRDAGTVEGPLPL